MIARNQSEPQTAPGEAPGDRALLAISAVRAIVEAELERQQHTIVPYPEARDVCLDVLCAISGV